MKHEDVLNGQTLSSKKKTINSEKIMRIIFFICGFTAVAAVAAISIYMIVSGGPALFKIGLKEFLFGTTWAPTASQPKFGIAPMILSSICATLGAILIGVPIALLTSIFLTQYAPKKLGGILGAAIDLLAGIPSVVYGLVGLLVVVPTVAKIFNLPIGTNLFSATLVLAVMILPTVINISVTSIQAVPRKLKEASLALGATQIQTIFKVILPAAKSGILTAVVLGIGRAVGETMAVIMVAGNVVNMPKIFESVRFLTTGIVMEMSYSTGLHKDALFAIGLVLFVFIMVLNIFINGVLKKNRKEK